MSPMMQYVFNFVAATLAVVAFLYLVYLYVRQNPQVGNMLAGSPKIGGAAGNNNLWVESALDLEPRKRLYVVRHKNQRFLLSTTMDKTEFLTTLESEPAEGIQSEMIETAENTSPVSPVAPALSPQAGLMERFSYSLKMVLGERFTRPGGR